MSARWRLAPTGFTPEKPGLPRWMSIFTAVVVSSRARCTSSGSVMGRRARERSFPSWVAAQAESCSRTRGSSNVTMDFSNRSVMVSVSPVKFDLIAVIVSHFRRFDKYEAASKTGGPLGAACFTAMQRYYRAFRIRCRTSRMLAAVKNTLTTAAAHSPQK